MNPPENEYADMRDWWAWWLAVNGVNQRLNELKAANVGGPVLDGIPEDRDNYKLLPVPQGFFPPTDRQSIRKETAKVCIVGAGSAGLFTGMLIDYLKEQAGLDLDYEILEAAGSNRVGGRLYSYKFGNVSTDPKKPDPHNYYDVGAMRFPDNPIMERTFDLFNLLDMKKADLGTDPPDGSLVPYYYKSQIPKTKIFLDEPWCFNGVTHWGKGSDLFGSGKDTFSINSEKTIPEDLFANNPDKIMTAVIGELRDDLKADGINSRKGWDKLMLYDSYSTRQYLAVPPPAPPPPKPPKEPQHDALHTSPKIPAPPYNYDTIEWMETFNGGTGWYDQALSETVLESLDFEYNDDTEWWCVMGGAQQLAIRMEKKVTNKPTYNTRVTAVSVTEGNALKLKVDFKDSDNKLETRTYDGVFNSTTLGCLQQIDTSKAGLNYATKQAIRSLGYGPSAKVGIKFKKAWWIHDLKVNKLSGGIGHSDLNLRTCVYPSYNLFDPDDKPAVLLCSYTWQQDAERMGALISSAPDDKHEQQLKEEQRLKEMLIQDLVQLHRHDGMTDEELYKLIHDNYIDHFAHDWGHDPNTVGAFAFFRPQQFSTIWPKMIQPSGNFVVVGEAASPHHAWVVGALESVVHGMYSFLKANQNIEGALESMKLLRENKKGDPFRGLPPYMSKDMAEWQAAIGLLTGALNEQQPS